MNRAVTAADRADRGGRRVREVTGAAWGLALVSAVLLVIEHGY